MAEGSHIEIASSHASIEDLKRKAVETPPIVKPSSEKRPSLQEVPLYFGAVFKGGKNEVHVDRPDLISTLDVNDEKDRTRFIFKNIHAFDYRYGKGSAWKVVVDDWIKDYEIANEGANIDSRAEEEFLGKLKAAMAVTASARAMESSGGSAKSYMVNLVGANERGEPITGEQDLSSSFLLHADPGKLNLVINDPLVKPFYDKLMEDAYIDQGPDSEWVGGTPNVVRLEKLNVESIRENSQLVKYLRNEAKRDDKKDAKGGGLQGYIEGFLLPKINLGEGVDDRVKIAAARIACDAFLVDKWTRWVDLITEQGATELDKDTALKLQPMEQWGGDPLNAVLHPSALPRMKKVYTGRDSVVLDLVDSAFRPMDIYDNLSERYLNGCHKKLPDNIRLPVPSMVTNLKIYAKYSTALDKFVGGPMAAGIPAWTPDVLNKDLAEIAGLIRDVYGVQEMTVKEKSGEDVPFEVGKHIAGAIMMRLLYTKALAATMESAKPGFGDKMEIILDPKNRDRPFLDVRATLFGIKLNGSSGFIKGVVEGRLDLVVWQNMFDAEKYYLNLRNLLETNDQRGGAYADTLHTLGVITNSLSSIGRAFGVVKK
jgi:hypothetical protein